MVGYVSNKSPSLNISEANLTIIKNVLNAWLNKYSSSRSSSSSSSNSSHNRCYCRYSSKSSDNNNSSSLVEVVIIAINNLQSGALFTLRCWFA